MLQNGERSGEHAEDHEGEEGGEIAEQWRDSVTCPTRFPLFRCFSSGHPLLSLSCAAHYWCPLCCSILSSSFFSLFFSLFLQRRSRRSNHIVPLMLLISPSPSLQNNSQHSKRLALTRNSKLHHHCPPRTWFSLTNRASFIVTNHRKPFLRPSIHCACMVTKIERNLR